MIDFPLILLCLVIFSGLVSIVYRWLSTDLLSAPPKVVEYARSLFPVLLVVFLVRSFLVQPYQVPSGSLKPTVLPGDFILVNQYTYGIRFPIWNTLLFSINTPKRGDVVLFHWPVQPKITFVKRIIGLPGDEISYRKKILYINGQKSSQKLLGCVSTEESGSLLNMCHYREDLLGKTHQIALCATDAQTCPAVSKDFYSVRVPDGYYFVMGDNRDNSDDSRDWGLVSKNALIGRAFLIWMSWNPEVVSWKQKIRWHRLFSWVQ